MDAVIIESLHMEILVHTGQHYDPELSDAFFEEPDITRPDYRLGVGSGLHGKQTGNVL
ncbi:MAG TPA: UDP-N-acetylglucosamine 2-epimerase [Methanospirillum sp.]|jgi:UDP-N-acetylglucosamine 2-epimerase|uniref:UDP-N-acetylglucosamine 2-epimerase n=1 Tax=Methanospirillum sp. TaxID=45200 RepID=UPI0026344CA8|nr:UDP-N-acetylglucosamine 2-epimerase [Methanospirillum sp.]HPY60085.1 UDP-N-acetylglucosamine 2-epimerase [Methanospirillum sp.]HQB99737.1 UDP-N-acetylglucosamine 2-epimerase [Methanospirillum sp.]